MAKKEHIYNLKEILEELKSTEGLPKNLSTEAQLWDEILKKEVFLMPEQLFPLIKEIYGKAYPKDTSVKPLGTEYSIEKGDTKEITSIRADITVLIGKTDIYHFECENKNDKTMVIRMFEYDTHITLSYQTSALSLMFPYSAVLYLQDNGTLPNTLHCNIHFQDGGSYDYTVPTVKVQSYSLEEIHQKHLSILIPFLPLRFRKSLHHHKKKNGFSKEALTSFYEQIILILEQEVQENYLSENNRNIILNLLNKSLIRVFYQDKSLLKEVVTMTEPILELEIEKYMYAAEDAANKLNSVQEELNQTNLKLNNAMDIVSLKENKLSQLENEIFKKDSEIAALKKQLKQLQLHS